jgi:hypothetical protein
VTPAIVAGLPVTQQPPRDPIVPDSRTSPVQNMPASTLPAGGLLLPQSLPPRALAVSANAPRDGGSSWSRAHSILLLWVEVKSAQATSALVGSHQQAGQWALKRAARLDGAQGLDGADEGTTLAKDAVGGGEVIMSHWHGD